MDMFEPGIAPRLALWEPIAAALRRAIILGELAPGLHLEELGLAEKFGVSRIPIREALTRLEHEGLVAIEPRRGAFVIGMSLDEVHDIYEFRLLVESHAIRRAAERSDDEGIRRLKRLADMMAEAVNLNQMDRVAEPDVSFHREIVRMAGSRRLLNAWEGIGGIIATILSVTDTTYRNMPRSVAGHYAIMEAVKRHDGDAAVADLRAHLSNGESVLREALPAANHLATSRQS
jgi:DNA-binding GntR family transcriptional regulator